MSSVPKLRKFYALDQTKLERFRTADDGYFKGEAGKILCSAKSYEGAVYICGYANELALKRRICLTLGWAEYPDDGKGSGEYSLS